MPCDDCGASVRQGGDDEHVCERERWLDYQVFQRRAELEGFEVDLGSYLDTPQGRFDLWYAERQRRRAA
jgi:hypothetical protein